MAYATFTKCNPQQLCNGHRSVVDDIRSYTVEHHPRHLQEPAPLPPPASPHADALKLEQWWATSLSANVIYDEPAAFVVCYPPGLSWRCAEENGLTKY